MAEVSHKEEEKEVVNADFSVLNDKLGVLLENQRLSLAYGALSEIPQLILLYLADKIEILDLSHNKFENLSFLEYFTNLQTLILDKNSGLDVNTLPVMENLRVLWLNNCNIVNVTCWLQTLQAQCPALKQLSMMCNPVGCTVLNGVTENDEKEYRKQVIKILPNLDYFDGIKITEKQRKSALKTKISLALLEQIFRKKVHNFMEISAKGYMSATKLHGIFVKTRTIAANHASS